MADPPWDIHMELPYGTMSDDEMRRMNVQVLPPRAPTKNATRAERRVLGSVSTRSASTTARRCCRTTASSSCG